MSPHAFGMRRISAPLSINDRADSGNSRSAQIIEPTRTVLSGSGRPLFFGSYENWPASYDETVKRSVAEAQLAGNPAGTKKPAAAAGGAQGVECADDDEEEAEEPPDDEDGELAGCADAGARLLQRSATRPP